MPQSDRGKTERELHQVEKRLADWTMWVGIFTGCLVATSLIGNLFIYYNTRQRQRPKLRRRNSFGHSLP
jgi:hypothetical protein